MAFVAFPTFSERARGASYKSFPWKVQQIRELKAVIVILVMATIIRGNEQPGKPCHLVEHHHLCKFAHDREHSQTRVLDLGQLQPLLLGCALLVETLRALHDDERDEGPAQPVRKRAKKKRETRFDFRSQVKNTPLCSGGTIKKNIPRCVPILNLSGCFPSMFHTSKFFVKAMYPC